MDAKQLEERLKVIIEEAQTSNDEEVRSGVAILLTLSSTLLAGNTRTFADTVAPFMIWQHKMLVKSEASNN